MSIILKNKDGVLLKTAGKYCPEDIIVKPNLQTKTATANGDISPDDGYCGLGKVTVSVPATPTQEKTITITENGTQEVAPDSGKVLSKVTVVTNVPSGSNLNVHYGDTAPTDTSKLWIKAEEPSNISFPAFWTAEQIVGGITDTGTTLSTAANSIGTAAVGTKIYLFGGYYGTSSRQNIIQVFNTETNTIQTLSTILPQGMANMGVAAVGTKMYLFGGDIGSGGKSNKIQVFNTETETIETLSTTLSTAANSMGVAAVGTKIYLFGGDISSDSKSNKIQVFNTETNTIQTLSTTLPQGMIDIGTAAVGTKIYLFGGWGNGYLNTIQVFNTETNTIQTLSTTLPQDMANMGTAAVGTKIYLFGGHLLGGKLNIIQVFNTETETIETLSTTLPTATDGIGTAAVGTKIYLFGGRDTARLDRINKFTVDVSLITNDIVVEQGTMRTFKVLKSPTEVEVTVKNVYKGDSNLAKFIDAYLFDGTNWVNVNTGEKAASGYSVTLRNGDVGGSFTYYINEDAGVELKAYDSRLPLTLNNVYKIRLQCTMFSFYLSNTTGSLIGHENDIFSNYVSITEDSSADVYTDQ